MQHYQKINHQLSFVLILLIFYKKIIISLLKEKSFNYNFMKLIFTFTLFVISILTYSQELNQIDKRALNYYSTDELKEMPQSKIKEVNFYYSESFIIPEEFKEIIKAENINIKTYEEYRQINERAKVYLYKETSTGEVQEESNYFIYLLSKNELKEAYKTLNN